MPRPLNLSSLDREIGWASTAFLESRLREREIFDWAAGLNATRQAERDAIRDLLNYRSPDLDDPYRTAWTWVFEAWDEPALREGARSEMIDALQAGYDPLAFVSTIAELVRPRLAVEPVHQSRRGRRPKIVHDLVSLKLDAGDLISLADLGLGDNENVPFLDHLATRLDCDLATGLGRADRIGGSAPALANWVERIYPKFLQGGDGEASDPDEYRGGFASLAKLLYQVFDRLCVLAPEAARRLAQGWRHRDAALFRRLWGAAARDPQIATPDEVGAFLRSIDDRAFWALGNYPEIAELRGLRFAQLNAADRAAIEARLRRLPPARQFFRTRTPEERAIARSTWARRELNRMAVGGGELSQESQDFIAAFDAANDPPTPLTSVTSDMDSAYEISWPSETVEASTEALDELLPHLERDLAGEDDRAKRSARRSVRARSDEILAAIAALADGAYPRTLAILADIDADRGRGHQPGQADPIDEKAQQLLGAISVIPAAKLAGGIGAFAIWLDVWASRLKADPRFWTVWTSLWPAAVAATNREPVVVDNDLPDFLDNKRRRDDRLAMEALNSSAGHMISALFNAVPDLKEVPHPFENPDLRRVRDAAFAATGDARLQVLHRSLTRLEYLRRADPAWAAEQLLQPLLRSDRQDIEIWDAIARRGLSRESFGVVGQNMAAVVRGDLLPPKTRSGLAGWVTYWTLIDMRSDTTPAVPLAEVQQMLRLGGDQVRLRSAQTLKGFLEAKDKSPAEQFTSAVEPFLREIWPGDHTLRSTSVSSVLAALPAAAGGQFVAAMRAVAHLIIPFDAWSLTTFGYYDRSKDTDGVTRQRFREMSSPEEAAAWLELLDLSIGRGDGAVYPRELSTALDGIATASRPLRRDPRYQRLVSLVRG
jgi:hypothetical protein